MQKMKLYSVEMTETELRLFSEFLEQREFEGKDEDYEEFLREAGTYFHSPDFDRDHAEYMDRTKESTRDHYDYDGIVKSNSYEIARDEMSNSMKKASNADLYLYKHPEVENTELGKKIRENSNKIWEREGNSWHSDKAKERREQRASDWANTLRMEGKFRKDSVDSLLNDYEEKRKTDSSKKYNPKTNKPLVEIDEDVPVITDEPEKEDTAALTKFQRDRKKEEFINDVKRIPSRASELYKEDTGGRSLGKDAAIAAGATAALGLGIYAIRKHNKKKKASKDQIESKYKTKK